jgi:hypothetical protein
MQGAYQRAEHPPGSRYDATVRNVTSLLPAIVLAACAPKPTTVECVDLSADVCNRAAEVAGDVLTRQVEGKSWLAVVMPGKAGQLDHVEVHACLAEGGSFTVDILQSGSAEPTANIREALSPVNPCTVRRLEPQAG